MNQIKKFLQDEDGVVAIEYVVIAAAIVLGLTVVFTDVGTTLTTKLQEVVNAIKTTSTTP